MNDPVSRFKSKALSASVGTVLVYHVGELAFDTASSPTLTQIQMMAHGLYLMGRVALRQRRVKNVTGMLRGDFLPTATEYTFKVLHDIGPVDFETARKLHLASIDG